MSKTRGLAVVTGASSGIGYELAKLLAADGYDLVLIARSREKLEAIAEALHEKHHVLVTPWVEDLGAHGGATQVAKLLAAESRPIEVLVNNAGIGLWGPFHAESMTRVHELLQLNIVALTELTRAVLPGMIERGRGRVLNVASTAAFQPGPLMAVYYASKAYVLHFSEAIAEELLGLGATVTALCPGPTTTGFVERAEMQKSKLFSRGAMDASTVAQIGYRAMWNGDAVCIPGFRNRLMAWSVRLAPRWLVPRIVKSIQAEQ